MNSDTSRPVIKTMDELRKYAATLPPYSGSITPVKTMDELKKRPYELSTFNEYITQHVYDGSIIISDTIITSSNTTVDITADIPVNK